MENSRSTENIAAELQEWIALKEAAKMHPDLSVGKLESWQKVGLLQNGGTGVRIWLPSKLLGKRRLVRAVDIADFLDALMPDAPKELVERFSQ